MTAPTPPVSDLTDAEQRWLDRVRAAHKPLTADQIALLRRVFGPDRRSA